ncbi:MAG TPA: hypothetical protein VE978_17720 [Chitinophagales bacterium]|nr:hypothetical protein [Chitinophagales bacterium]
MKTLLLLTFGTIVIVTQGQDLPPKVIGIFDWTMHEVKLPEKQKLNYLNKLVGSKFFTPFGFSNDSDKYHLIDFNSDGLMDIIYEGRNPPGIETDNVAFFLNEKDSLRLIVKLNGNFSGIEKSSTSSPIRFQIIKSPCCADYIYQIENYGFSKSGDCFIPKNSNDDFYQYAYGQVNDSSFCVTIKSHFAYVLGTDFPKELKSSDTVFTNAATYLTPIAMKPSDTDFKKDGLYFHMTTNKAIAKIDSGTKCIVLAEKKSSVGKAYCFVMLINTNEEQNYLAGFNFYQYGWIEKRFLK